MVGKQQLITNRQEIKENSMFHIGRIGTYPVDIWVVHCKEKRMIEYVFNKIGREVERGGLV